MYFKYIYDFQRALYKDPELISVQFQLVQNIQVKYSIVDSDFYNFDKTDFLIDQIKSGIVITYTNQYSRIKIIQLGNQE